MESAQDSKMAEIEKRLLSLESLGVADNYKIEEALNEYKVSMLSKLKQIRTQIVEECGDVAKLKQERDQAVAENAQLKKENERLKYRVNHLVKALNEEENRK